MHLPSLFKSASFRLAAVYVALFGISVVVLGAIVYLQTTSEFRRQAERRIEAEADALHRAYDQGGLPQLLAAIGSRQRSKVAGGLDYTVYDPQGHRLVGSLEDMPFKAGWSMIQGPPDGDEKPGELEDITVLTVALSDRLWLSVGDDLVRIEEFGEVVLETFAWVLILSMTLAVLGGLILSALFLGRVSAITDTAEAIISGDIQRRVPRRRTADELDRLAATLNHMLDRIGALMEALRQVSSSIAHELRTPLTHLRQTLELARSRAVDGPAEAAVEQAVAEAEAVLSTFSALLRIAQIEAGTRRQGFGRVDLSQIVESIAQTFAPIAEDSGRTLRWTADHGIRVLGDSELLTQLVVNLVENAIRHTPPGTVIDIALKASPGPVLIVSDNGQGIPEGERSHVFERFYRLDDSVPGSGLGLSMVAAVADLHDIQIRLDDNGPGLRVRLDFSAVARPAHELSAAVPVLAETVR